MRAQDVIIKVNRRNKMQERIFLLTETAIYNVDPGNYKCKRRIQLKELGSVSLSKLPDNFFALHIPHEHDYLLVSSKKTEVVSRLIEAYENLTGEPLSINFSNSFEYRISDNTMREIHFSRVEGGVSTQIYVRPFRSARARAAWWLTLFSFSFFAETVELGGRSDLVAIRPCAATPSVGKGYKTKLEHDTPPSRPTPPACAFLVDRDGFFRPPAPAAGAAVS